MTHANSFTNMVVDTKLNVLRRLHGMLENDSLKSKEQFWDLMQASFQHLPLEPRALSDDLGFSFSTVYRWIEGRTSPHPSLWPVIVQWIMKSIESELDKARLLEAEDA